MTFTIRKIALKGFRNHGNLEIDLSEGVTILVGPNAIGKTNVIEALELLAAGTSFRKTNSWDELVPSGETIAKASISAVDDCGERLVSLQVPAGGRRKYSVNGKPIRTVSSLAGIIPTVVFTPDDLGLVKGTASSRRKALDDLGRQLSAAYSAIVDDFELVLRQRNAVLREEPVDEMTLEALTGQFIETAARLLEYRHRLFARVAEACEQIHPRISGGERLSVSYESSSPGDDDLRSRVKRAVTAAAAEDRARRVSSRGPHKDDISFAVDGKDARIYGSQGQQRSIALTWKLAEVAVIEQISGRRPLLLLDDVMSELDDTRRAALTEAVKEAAQAVITTTDLAHFSEEFVSRARVVRL